jgi:hypothetical protein
MKIVPSFWITNISERNVSLADLDLTIKALTSVNLLDAKHHTYTRDQLEKSAQSGSIFKKQRLLRVRQIAPILETINMPIDRDAIIPSRQRSVLDIKENKYEELAITDEQFVEELIETEPQTAPKGKK